MKFSAKAEVEREEEKEGEHSSVRQILLIAEARERATIAINLIRVACAENVREKGHLFDIDAGFMKSRRGVT